MAMMHVVSKLCPFSHDYNCSIVSIIVQEVYGYDCLVR